MVDKEGEGSLDNIHGQFLLLPWLARASPVGQTSPSCGTNEPLPWDDDDQAPPWDRREEISSIMHNLLL